MASPLGKYSQIVAAILAVAIIAAWITAELLAGAGIIPSAPVGLPEVAFIAVGAVFGSTATTNGIKDQLAAVHTRLDAMGAPPASDVTPPLPPA